MRSDFLKLGLLKEEFLLHPNIMQDLYKIFQNQEPLFASVEKIANNSVTYEIVKNVAVILYSSRRSSVLFVGSLK